MDNCVHFDFETANGGKGDEVCIKVRVSNFKDITAFQFPLNFDPRVMIPTGTKNFASLVGWGPGGVNFDTLKGVARALWTEPNGLGDSLPDGTVLYEVCFKLVGSPGECTKVIANERTLTIEFIRKYPVDIDSVICAIDDNPNDEVCIQLPTKFCVISSRCGTQTSTGTMTIKAWGGREPYRVEVNSIPQTDKFINKDGDCIIINGQKPGTYNVKVTDGLGKDTMFDIRLDTVPDIVVTNEINYTLDPTCWFSKNGRIGINVTGGTGPKFIKWLPQNVFDGQRIRLLGPGTYTAVVSDSTGCTVSKDIVLRADSLYAVLTVDKPVSCAGKCDGKATVRAFGGKPCFGKRYEYIWNQGSSKDCRNDTTCMNDSLCNNFFVVVRDCNKCEDTLYFNIPIGSELKNQISIDSIKCIGDSARINSKLTSTSALNFPITFDLRDISNTSIAGGTTTLDSYTSNLLRPGRYYLYTTDALGCSTIDTILIVDAQPLSILENQIDTLESCSPGGDALIDVRGVGGTQPYTYLWSNGPTTNRVDTFSAGTYTVTVTDRFLCTTTRTYIITKPIGPKIDSLIVTDVPCIEDKSGCVEVIFTQGSTAVGIKWNVPGNTSKICNLDTGSYTVILTDLSGCMDTASTRVKVGTGGILIDSAIIMNPSCPGKSDGLIIVFAKGGNGQLSYSWSNNSTSAVNSNLKAGQYILSVDDIAGCPEVRDTFILVDKPRPVINITPLLTPSCAENDTCDGSAFVTINTADTIVVAYWSSSNEQRRYISQTGFFRDTASKLCSGPQYVIISTNDLCSDTVFFNMPIPRRITFDSTKLIVQKPTCYGRTDGSITVDAKGGCSPYKFDWVNPIQTGPTINQLGDGYYKVKITDCRGCVHFDSVRLRQPDTIRVQIIPGSSFDITCPGKKDGIITLAWNGGSGGKGKFNWTPNVSQDSVLNNLSAGTYSVTVTDNNNCTGVASFNLNEPPPISLLLSPIDTPKCTNDQAQFSVIQATGGTGAVFQWTIDQGAPNLVGTTVPLFSGSYKITVYDRNGCSKDTVITIPDPIGDIDLDFGIEVDTISLGDSVRLLGVINAQSLIDSFIWDPVRFVSTPNSSDSYVKPSETTNFMLTVVDENGCRATDKVLIVVESIRRFFTPNVISPNGDNTNDNLEFTVGPDVQNIDLVEIYDRWGGRLYQVKNPSINGSRVQTWDGRSNGEVVNPGVYVYIAKVNFKDGFTLVYRGDLTVVR